MWVLYEVIMYLDYRVVSQCYGPMCHMTVGSLSSQVKIKTIC